MATALQNTYVWKLEDSRWKVAGQQMVAAGYTDSLKLAEDIASANHPDNVLPGMRGYLDWGTVPAGAVIIIPHAS